MKTKTSIRFFNKAPVRARWDNEVSGWWYVATDVISALVGSKNPRVYWSTLKRRNPKLFANCKQLKITAEDGKRYNTDCLNEYGIRSLVRVLPVKTQKGFMDWFEGLSDPLDEQSKRKAYELYENSLLDKDDCVNIQIGTITKERAPIYRTRSLYAYVKYLQASQVF